MVLESLALPGWELILFIVLVFAFLITGGVVSFIILSRLRWPLKWVLLEYVAGDKPQITRRGRCRMVTIGDMGEEVFLLKHLNKYKLGEGKRLGHKQIGWIIADDGLWYQFDFEDFNKKLRQIGMRPASKDVRLGMSAVRKNTKQWLENKSWLDKHQGIIYFGMFIIILFIFAGILWYSTNKQVEIARINAASQNASVETQVATQKTLAQLDNLLARIQQLNTGSPNTPGGSGLISNG